MRELGTLYMMPQRIWGEEKVPTSLIPYYELGLGFRV